MTISRVENACKPLILLGLQKNKEKISTHLLTVLIIGAIVQIEQRKRKRSPNPEVPNTTLRIASIVLKYSFHIYERRYDLC